MKRIFIAIITIFFSYPLFSKDMFVYKYFSFDHPTCNIWLAKKTSPYWNHYGEDFRDLVIEKLKIKRFKIINFTNNKKRKMAKGDLHLMLRKTILPEGFYKKCLVKFQIKQAATKYSSQEDNVLYEKDSLRSLPRHTFRGEERCLYALKDSFGIIPYCNKVPLK